MHKISTSLWRYMPYEKFLWLLDDGGIFFSKASSFEDANEGSIPIDSHHFHGSKIGYSLSEINSTRKLLEELDDIARAHRYISCWHMSDCLDDHMWKEYGKCTNENKEAVAIKIDWFSLCAAIPEEFRSSVRFDDCTYATMEPQSNKDPFSFKGDKYLKEKEHRIHFDAIELAINTGINLDNIAQILSGGKGLISNRESSDLYKKGNGAVMKIDLTRVIQEIHVPFGVAPSFIPQIGKLLASLSYEFPIYAASV